MNVWPEAMVTAHRKLPRHAQPWLQEVLPQKIAKLREECCTERFTSGMAIGGDQIFAAAVRDLQLPLRGAIPYPDQHLDGTDGHYGPRWSRAQRSTWAELCEYARNTGGLEQVAGHNPRSSGERVRMLFKRNDWMLDRSNVVLALWQPTIDGQLNNRGGTYDSIIKAVSAGMPVILFDLNALTITMPTPEQWVARLGGAALAVARPMW